MISATHLRWRARLPEAPHVLIAAHSGRALAEAARLSGFAPLVTDYFGDADTCRLARAWRVVSGDLIAGFDEVNLIAAIQSLADAHQPVGLVWGTGFEDRPSLLAALAQRWQLLGNAPTVVARVKNPQALAALCREAGVPHPETRLERPRNAAGWLAKREGGSGGTHIFAAGASHPPETGCYYQRKVPGVALSLLVLADGQDCQILGTSRQWANALPGQPFRYGGALRWAGLMPPKLAALSGAATRLARAAGLVGLNSFDFLVSADGFRLLEINPRPGATLDVFTHAALFSAHIEACHGRLPATPLEFSGAQAAAIVYCAQDLDTLPPYDWPNWVKDQPKPFTPLQNGAPICTIVASAAKPNAARQLLNQRINLIRQKIADISQANGRRS